VPRRNLSESTVHTILRIVRELSSNAVRHGGATRLVLVGGCSEGTLRFTVEDNGCGFDPLTAGGAKEGHFGIQGIRERIKQSAGEMKIESSPGKGTKVSITMKPKELK